MRKLVGGTMLALGITSYGPESLACLHEGPAFVSEVTGPYTLLLRQGSCFQPFLLPSIEPLPIEGSPRVSREAISVLKRWSGPGPVMVVTRKGAPLVMKGGSDPRHELVSKGLAAVSEGTDEAGLIRLQAKAQMLGLGGWKQRQHGEQ